MKKSHTTNTFADGLIMDLNPVVTPNSALTNCLNGTIVTFNGNENALQNDMGNGRVKTAYLPEGYVPLGTAELGGIIYVVSYNPQTNKCQIGSFPSPERNIDSAEEGDDFNVTLTNEDFGFDPTNGAKIYYLKKKLGKELTFNPGDKFVVYGDTIAKNYYKFYNSAEYTQSNVSKAKNQTLKLKLGAITNDGKLVEFTDLKSFTIEKPVIAPEEVADGSAEYHIMQHDNSSGTASEKLDSAASLASQQYNIFSSKVSGQLVIIAELIKFDNFSATIKHKFNSGTTKTYSPEITFDLSGNEEFMPYAIKCELMLSKITTQDTPITGIAYYKNIATYTVGYESGETGELSTSKDGDFKNYTILKNLFNDAEEQNDNFKSIISTIKGIDFNNKDEDQRSYILKYTFTPCMNWGEIAQLAVSGTVDLSKLGTGYMNIAQWKYYNQPNKQIVNWGFEIYEENGKTVNDLEINFYSIVGKSDNTYEVKKLKFNTDKKTSYHGNFSYDLPLNQEWYKYEDCTADVKTDEKNHITAASNTKNTLDLNNLYLVEFILKYIDSSDASAKTEIEDRKFYRWMYTNGVFNSKYFTENDFNTLQPEFDIDYAVDYSYDIYQPEYIDSIEKTTKNPYTLYGVINPETEGKTEGDIEKLKASKSSLSCIQTRTNVTIDTSVEFKLKQDYDTFSLGAVDENTFNFNINSVDATTSSTPTPLGQEDSNYKEWLASFWGVGSTTGDVESIIKKEIISGKPGEDNSEAILNKSDKSGTISRSTFKAFYKDSSPITSTFENNTYKFSLTIPTLQLVKAYCSKKEDTLTYTGSLKPLAYNAETFGKYNLEFTKRPEEDGILSWYPTFYGAFGWDYVHKKGHRNFIGTYSQGGSYNDGGGPAYKSTDKGGTAKFMWNDSRIINKENSTGWKNAIIFAPFTCGDQGSILTVDDYPFYSMKGNLPLKAWRVIFSLLKSQDDQTYYPIFMKVSSNKFEDNVDSFNKVGIKYYYAVASLLSVWYQYRKEEVQYKCLVPTEDIFYMRNCQYGINLNLTITEKENSKLDVNIKIGGILENLNTIGTTLSTIGNPGFNNIETKISLLDTNSSILYNIPIKTTEYETDLRNYFNNITTSGWTAVFDYDGVTKIGNTPDNFDSSTVYSRTSGTTEIKKLPNKETYNKMKYSLVNNKLVIQEEEEEEEKNEYASEININDSFSNKLCIGEDGTLQLKNTTSQGDLSAKKSVSEGTDSVYGWQNVKLLNYSIFE